jgi:hypothetical protein
MGIAAMLAVCAGCGSSSSSSSSAATAASSGTSTPATTTATTGSGGSGGGGVSDAAFCGEAKATSKSLQKITSQIAATGTPSAFKTLLQDDQSAYSKLVADSPSDIHADAETLQTDFNKIIAFFAKYNYDVQQAVPHIGEMQALINSPKLKAAENHIKTWGDTNCS